MQGVYQAKHKDGSLYYRASLTFQNKHISLGSYLTQKEAYRAYEEGSTLLRGDVRYLPEDYATYQSLCQKKSHGCVLSFQKWISLLQFRNHGIYMKTPIYMRQSFFQYFLSQKDILIFDVDDLFFYSHHSIMRRGSHLFVADFGMQINLLSRYGIPAFAVCDRDYFFVNGDCHDWRYSNIEIVNQYHGVFQKKNKGHDEYQSRIHVHGDWNIGSYSTPEEAAVAYNKAADLLQQKGIVIHFQKNFIESFSPKEYEIMYEKVKIADRILHFHVQ